MAEYRLEDLARVSGVSARNIRAYRERGLLAPPRRQGRAAFYDEYHLTQLNTISQLLRRGYNSAHIAEFFARMREGHDLAAILGVQQAGVGHPGDRRPTSPALGLDPRSEEVRRLLTHGFADLIDDSVFLVDASMAEIVTRSDDQLACVQMILRAVESTEPGVDAVAAALIAAVEESIAARYGSDYPPARDRSDELAQLTRDYHMLGIAVVTHLLAKA